MLALRVANSLIATYACPSLNALAALAIKHIVLQKCGVEVFSAAHGKVLLHANCDIEGLKSFDFIVTFTSALVPSILHTQDVIAGWVGCAQCR